MTKQTWFDKGYRAFEVGEPKLFSWEQGARHFNEGWEKADRQHRWGEEVEQHNKLAGELEDLKKRICGYGESLDLDDLTELLYEMGARA